MSAPTHDPLLAFLRAEIAQRTGMPPEQIDADSPLARLGLKSIDAVLLCGEVEDRFAVEVDPSDIFEHDTLGEFVAAIVQRAAG